MCITDDAHRVLYTILGIISHAICHVISRFCTINLRILCRRSGVLRIRHPLVCQDTVSVGTVWMRYRRSGYDIVDLWYRRSMHLLVKPGNKMGIWPAQLVEPSARCFTLTFVSGINDIAYTIYRDDIVCKIVCFPCHHWRPAKMWAKVSSDAGQGMSVPWLPSIPKF